MTNERDKGGGLFDTLTEMYNRYVTKPVSDWDGALDRLSEPVRNTYNAVVDDGASVVDSVRNGISGLFNNTVQAFMEMLWDGALRFVGSIVGGENSSLGG